MDNSLRIMEGPADLWHYARNESFEWANEQYTTPIFIRPAYRRGEPADGFTQLRDRVADWFDSFHLMDLYPVRVLYRAARSIDNIVFGLGKHREMTWATGIVLVACVTAVAYRMLAR